MKNQKNDLITSYVKVDLIKHLPTKSDLLYKLQVQKEQLFKDQTLDELREFNERIYPQSPRYGILYE
jgi:hypothetical protein